MNIPKSSSKSVVEFQAVILAGPGSNLSPLTRNYVRGHGIEEPVPKALLPIGNKPMLSYPLAWLDAAGVTDVLVVCPASQRSLMSHFIYSSAEFPSLRMTIQTMDDDESMGTADVLREISSSIQTDFIVLPCDFVPPADLTLSQLLDAHRMDVDGPILTALLYERGEVTKDGPPLWAAGLEEKTKTLMHVPVEEAGDDVQLRMSLMWKAPRVRFTTRYLDSHVYVLKRAVLDLLAERTDLSSIKEELIPWLCRAQYRIASKSKYGHILKPTRNSQALALEHTTVRQTVHAKSPDDEDVDDDNGGGDGFLSARFPSRAMSVASSMPASPRMGGKNLHDEDAPPVDIRCTYVVHQRAKGAATRANTLKTYFDANRQCLREGSYIASNQPSSATTGEAASKSLIDIKSQISSDSLIGPSTKVGERASIKKSVIGSHCIIGKNVRISGCVLMDHVVVKDGAKLDNSILSRHTTVEEKCAAKDCEAATGVVLAAGGDYKGEKIEQFETDDDTVDDDEGDEDDEGDDDL